MKTHWNLKCLTEDLCCIASFSISRNSVCILIFFPSFQLWKLIIRLCKHTIHREAHKCTQVIMSHTLQYIHLRVVNLQPSGSSVKCESRGWSGSLNIVRARSSVLRGLGLRGRVCVTFFFLKMETCAAEWVGWCYCTAVNRRHGAKEKAQSLCVTILMSSFAPTAACSVPSECKTVAVKLVLVCSSWLLSNIL